MASKIFRDWVIRLWKYKSNLFLHKSDYVFGILSVIALINNLCRIHGIWKCSFEKYKLSLFLYKMEIF